MDTFVQRYDVFPAFAPTLAAVVLFVAVFEARRQRPVLGRTVAAAVILCISWLFPTSVLYISLPTLLIGMGVDQFYDPRFAKQRRANLAVTLFTVVLYASVSVFLLGRTGSRQIQMTESSLVAGFGSNQMAYPKGSLRIVEFYWTPNREWHLKAGQHVIGVREDDWFEDANGTPWSPRELIAKIEVWAGIRREHVVGAPK